MSLGRRLAAAVATGTVLLSVTGAAGAGAGSAAHAEAAGPVFVVRGTVPGHPEILRAEFAAGAEVESVRADIIRLTNGSTVTTTALAFDAAAGQWRSAPLKLDLGLYGIVFEAKDADGNVARRGGGDLDYRRRPVMEDYRTSPAALDVAHPTLTVTGRISFYDPRTATQATASTGRVSLSLTNTQASDSAALREDGSFTLRVTPGDHITDDVVSGAVMWHAPDASPTISPTFLGTESFFHLATRIPVTVTPARFLMDQSSLTNVYPKLSTISGTLQRWTGDAWGPAPGIEVGLSGGDRHGGSGSATTGTDGRFSITTGWYTSGTVRVRLADPLVRPFMTPTTTAVTGSVKVTVRQRSIIDLQKAKVSRGRKVSFGGILSRDPGGDWTAGKVRVHLQRSADGKTGWKSLGSTLTDRQGAFAATLPTIRVHGYFRLYYAGTTTLQPSTSKRFRATIQDTRIAGFKVSKTSVAKGGTVTLTGKLQKFDGTTWVPVTKSRALYVLFRTPKQKSAGDVAVVRTTSSGTFSIKVRVKRAGYWSASLSGYQGLADARSPERYVKLR